MSKSTNFIGQQYIF